MAQQRREALKIIGAIGTTCAFPFPAAELYGQHVHITPAFSQAARPAGPRVFTKAEFEFLSRLADLIIPPTDTPGGAQAGVPDYIDYVASSNSFQQKRFREGFAWLDAAAQKRHGRKFLELAEPDQVAILQPLSDAVDANRGSGDAEVEFFRILKNLTADGYYTSEAGLVKELGYSGNTVLSRFPDCDLPGY
jgi:hypothetical protein